jgi:hypothetical protein
MDSKPPPFATASSEESCAYFDKATAISSHYCVILNFPEAKGIGSGTLVSIAGKFGILTADHVSDLLQRTEERFMICLGDTPTSLTVFKAQYRNIVIGDHSPKRALLGPTSNLHNSKKWFGLSPALHMNAQKRVLSQESR